MTLIVGPVLGFRGLENGVWRTCALVVFSADADPPKLSYAAGTGGWKEVKPRNLAALPGGARALRFDWGVEQEEKERTIEYNLGGGESYAYCVPEKGASPRIIYGSCAGFHDLKAMRDIKGKKNAMWEDIERRYEREGAYHLMVMGGDQVYADGLWEEIPQLKEWLQKPLDEKGEDELTEETLGQLSSFYFELYRENWGQEEVRRVMSQVPSLMMWDDHDIFDGYGSKSKVLQETPTYRGVYAVAREYFRLFQLQAGDDADLPEGAMVLKADEETNRQSNFTYAYHLSDHIALTMLDMRSQRTRDQVMAPKVWAALRSWMWENLDDCKHFLVVSTIPLVYFDATFFESTLGVVPGQQDIEDDFRDQWQSRPHLDERLDLIHCLFDLAQEKGCRATVVSGDVHLAAFGHVESESNGSVSAEERAIVQLISSPIVNKPAPGTVVFAMEHLTTLMGVLGRKTEEVDRGIRAEMLQVPGTSQHFIRRRNWLSLEMVKRHRLQARWIVECAPSDTDFESSTTTYRKDVFPIKH